MEKTKEGLNLISTVTPDYSYARRKGYSDYESEMIANNAINEAIELLEELSVPKSVKETTLYCLEDIKKDKEYIYGRYLKLDNKIYFKAREILLSEITVLDKAIRVVQKSEGE